MLLLNGFRFFFYSNENDEPIHVHVTKGDGAGKIWLEPSTRLVYLNGFSKADEKAILKIVDAHADEFKRKWNEYFNK